MARDQGPGPMPSVCRPALKNDPPKTWRTPQEPTLPQPPLDGWEFDKQPPRELIRPDPPPPPEPVRRVCSFVKHCDLPDGQISRQGRLYVDLLRDYGEVAVLGAKERDDSGNLPLERINAPDLPKALGGLAIAGAAVGEAGGGLVPGITTGVAGGLLIGLVTLVWSTRTGDSALYTEDELRGMATARTRVRLHIEQQPDGKLRGYAFNTERLGQWEQVPVVQFQPQGDRMVADVGGIGLIWTPATDPSDKGRIPTLEQAPNTPAILVFPSEEKAGETFVNPVLPDDYRDAIVVFPADSGVPPLYVVMNVRLDPGVVTGQGEVVTGIWLEQASRELGAPIPAQIADRLRGKAFASFDAFRAEFWRAVADDFELSSQFSNVNRRRMRGGSSPFVIPEEAVGGRISFELHHVDPVAQGGPVYDLDNLRVNTPRNHIELHQKG
ncbi:S-type pyocin domain-containing protein [Pseudomonas indica]|nr:S-type pyocin domain-containing protein [Pseudomonas indica]